jgi:hypothetical protein
MMLSLSHTIFSFLISVVLFAIGQTPVFARDSTIPCRAPPDKVAFVAVREGSTVTTTQDKQNGSCTFSVNGAVATSPPANDVIRALNVFRSKPPSFLNPTVATQPWPPLWPHPHL